MVNKNRTKTSGLFCVLFKICWKDSKDFRVYISITKKFFYMRADSVKITGLFQSNTVLRIPYYQRAYVWDSTNWERFYNDIISLLETDDNYFLGSIILKSTGKDENNYPVYNVVDGQQRLTTLIIFAKVLYSIADRLSSFKERFYLEDSDIPILTPGRKDSIAFDELLKLEGLFPLNCNGRIREAYDFFCKKLNTAEIRSKAQTLLKKMNNQVQLVRITVEGDENEQQIFDTINSLGLDLTTGELLKNHFFDRNNSDLYDEEWAPVFDREYWNSDQLKGRKNNKAAEAFFYQFMLVKLQDSEFKGKITPEDRKRYRKQDHLFESFKDLMEKQAISKEDMIKEIVEYAKLYQDIIDPAIMDEVLVKVPAVKRIVTIMFAGNFWTPVPYILYLLKNVPDTADRDNLFRYMETYLMRRIICSSKNNNYSDMFSENLIGGGITTYEGFKAYVNDTEHRAVDLLMPSDEEVSQAIKDGSFKKDEAKLVLYFLEAKYNPSFRNEVFDNEYSNISAEALLPSKPNKNWALPDGMTPESMEKASESLSNYVLVRGSKVSGRISSKAWTDKKKALSAAADGLHLSRVLTFDSWGASEIARRTNSINTMVLETWAK